MLTLLQPLPLHSLRREVSNQLKEVHFKEYKEDPVSWDRTVGGTQGPVEQKVDPSEELKRIKRYM